MKNRCSSHRLKFRTTSVLFYYSILTFPKYCSVRSMLSFYPRATGQSCGILSSLLFVLWLQSISFLIVLTMNDNSVILATGDGNKTNTTIITVRAGVMINQLPFTDYNDMTSVYWGYHLDLLNYTVKLAEREGYTLNLELETVSQNFNTNLDLIANDCNTTANPNLLEDCNKYDIIIGGYYFSEERFGRIDFSPAIVATSTTTIKVVTSNDDNQKAPDFATLSELEEGGGTVCLVIGAYLSEIVMEQFPKVNVNFCEDLFICLKTMKDRDCDMFVWDEMELRYHDRIDLVMPGEKFDTQFLYWPMNSRWTWKTVFKKWMYRSIIDTHLDHFHYKYLEEKICPLGTSGKNCDQDCDPEHGRSDVNGDCQCHSLKWFGKNCSLEVKEEKNLIPKALVVLGYIFFSINLFAFILCAVWLHWKRKSKQVKVSQPFFLYLVLLGCTIETSTIVIMVQQDAGDGLVVACPFIPWFFTIGFSVTFGTLFAKILRVYRLFRNAAQMQRIKITTTETLVYICGITSVDIIICLAWTLTNPMQWTREVLTSDRYEIPLASQGSCTSNHRAAFVITISCWHIFLLGTAMYLCFVSRHISSRYTEAKPLAFVTISQFLIYIIYVLVAFIVDHSVSIFMIWLNNFCVILIIFGNLMYAVHWDKTDNLEIGSAVKSFCVLEKESKNKRATWGGTCNSKQEQEIGSLSLRTAQQTRRRSYPL